MLIQLQNFFPASSATALATTKDYTGSGYIPLDGELASNGSVSFISKGYSRNISFTCTSDMSSSTIDIYGKQNGVDIIEQLTCPNNDVIYSTNIFDEVTQVVLTLDAGDNPGTGVSIGTGVKGFFKPISVNLQANDSYINSSLVVSHIYNAGNANVVPFNIYYTYENILFNGLKFINQIPADFNTVAGYNPNYAIYKAVNANADATHIIQITEPLQNILVYLNGSTTTMLDQAKKLTFIQK